MYIHGRRLQRAMSSSFALWSLRPTTTFRLQGCTSTSVYGSVVQRVSARALRLCAFRGRSRHTTGFAPLDKFELPERELLAAANVDRRHQNHRMSFRPTAGSEVFQWVESCLDDTEITDAASRCVLLHGVFEVWGYGKTKDEAAADLSRSGRIPQHLADTPWSLSGTSFGSPQLTREEEDILVGGSVMDALSTQLSGPRTDASSGAVRVHIIEDICPPAMPTFFAANGRKRSKRGRDIDGISYREGTTAAKPPREKQFYICRVLQMGPAVGARAVIGMTARRPKSGILKLLALNDRKGKGATAIEPEVALLMVNLAKVRSGSLVLDPFCGSCSLLLPAAKMGARTWGGDIAGPAVAASVVEDVSKIAHRSAEAGAGVCYGKNGTGDGESPGKMWIRKEDDEIPTETGSDRESLEAVYDDFRKLRLREPHLVMADIADAESSLRRPDFYDAIITDPPYNVKEPVQVTGIQHRNSTTASNAAESAAEYPREKLGHGAPKQDDRSIRDSALAGDTSHQCSGIGRTYMQYQRTEAGSPTPLRPASENSNRRASWGCSDVPNAATVVAEANRLVGEVVLSLLSVARYALKPGGRLVFFLPLRDEDARVHELPSAVREKLEERSVGEGDEGVGATQLSIVYAAKQLLTSPNLCRWLVVLEKEGM